MGIKVSHLRKYIIQPTLKILGLYSRDAEELLIATAAHESHLGEYLHQEGGPALGIYQMEPKTHKDIWGRYLIFKEGLYYNINNLRMCNMDIDFRHGELEGNLYYATAMARVHYLRVPEKLPDYRDIVLMATYWGKYYQTESDPKKINQFVKDYWQYVEGG